MRACAGRALDPELAGSALALLSLPRVEALSGRPGRAGRGFHPGRRSGGRRDPAGAGSGGGGDRRSARRRRGAGRWRPGDGRGAVISTLDLRQSLLSLFPWAALPAHMLEEARNWRMAGATARLLLALQAAAAPRQAFVPGGRRRGARRLPPWRGAADAAVAAGSGLQARRQPGAARRGHRHRHFERDPLPSVRWRLDAGEAHRVGGAQRLLRIEKALARARWPLFSGVRIITPPDMESAAGRHGRRSRWRRAGARPDAGAPRPDRARRCPAFIWAAVRPRPDRWAPAPPVSPPRPR